MKYPESYFYPGWIPLEIRSIVDLSELAETNEQVIEEANVLMEILGVNIAVYKNFRNTPQGRHNGLCSLFKSAVLQNDQLEILYEAERRLKNYIIVAYANPLQYHSKSKSNF